MSVFHRHRWVPVDVFPLNVYLIPKTEVLQRCEVCGAIKTIRLDGLWSLEQVRQIEPKKP